MPDYRRLFTAQTTADDPVNRPLPGWATSRDFLDFETGADGDPEPAVYRDGPTAAERALGIRETDGYLAQVQNRPAQPTPAEIAAQKRAEKIRQGIFAFYDKNPDAEINGGRWFREQAFGAKRNDHNILQDRIGLYDPDYSATMREALRRATPAEVDAVYHLLPKNPLPAIFGQSKPLNLTDDHKRMYIDMMQRAGPNGQKVAKGAREHWGLAGP